MSVMHTWRVLYLGCVQQGSCAWNPIHSADMLSGGWGPVSIN